MHSTSQQPRNQTKPDEGTDSSDCDETGTVLIPDTSLITNVPDPNHPGQVIITVTFRSDGHYGQQNFPMSCSITGTLNIVFSPSTYRPTAGSGNADILTAPSNLSVTFNTITPNPPPCTILGVVTTTSGRKAYRLQF